MHFEFILEAKEFYKNNEFSPYDLIFHIFECSQSLPLRMTLMIQKTSVVTP